MSLADRIVRLKSPHGYWRVEDGDGSVVTIPNGIRGLRTFEDKFSCFDGRMVLDIPRHWMEPIDQQKAGKPK